MSEDLSLTALESLLGVHLSQEQRRAVVAQFLKGNRARVVAPQEAGPLGGGDGDAYGAAVDRAFLAVFGAPRENGSEPAGRGHRRLPEARRGHAGLGWRLPLRFRNPRPPSLRIAIEILAHRAAADRALRFREPHQGAENGRNPVQ